MTNSTTDPSTAPGETPPNSSTGTSTATAVDDGKLDRDVLLVASVVVLGAIMSILDVTVVNVAIPVLVDQLDTTLTTIQWVSTGYTLALATVIPLTGWGADRFGTKRLYLGSLVLFVLGSILAGIAWSPGSLIAFRVLQGFGGGMIMPLGMTILTRAAGPHRIGRVMAVIGVPMLLGPIFGPILGGWLIDAYSWHWIFLINVPIGAIAIAATIRILPKDRPEAHHKLDWLGALLLSPGLALIIYGFAEGASGGGFDEIKSWGTAALGIVLFVAFVFHALTTENPLVDLRLYANKVYAAANITLFLMIVSVFGGMLLIPLYFQVVRGESALQTGLLLVPQGIGAMIAMPIAGRLTDVTGVGKIVPFGLITVAVSFAGLTQLEADTSYVLIGVWLFLMGVGMGFTMMPTFSGAMQTLRRANIAQASTSLNIVQQVGASVGTAVLSILLANGITSKIEALNLPAAAGGADGGGGLGGFAQLSDQAKAVLMPPIAQAFGQTFIWAAALVLVALVVATILLPKHKPEPLDEPDAEGAAPLMVH